MKDVSLYTSDHCPYCRNAKALLERKGVTAIEYNVANDPQLLREMLARTGRRSVPQIYIGEQHVGGFDDLAELERKGELEGLLH